MARSGVILAGDAVACDAFASLPCAGMTRCVTFTTPILKVFEAMGRVLGVWSIGAVVFATYILQGECRLETWQA